MSCYSFPLLIACASTIANVTFFWVQTSSDWRRPLQNHGRDRAVMVQAILMCESSFDTAALLWCQAWHFIQLALNLRCLLEDASVAHCSDGADLR